MNPYQEQQLSKLARLHRELNPPLKSTAKLARRAWKRLQRAKQPHSMVNITGNGGAWLRPAPVDERTKKLLAAYRRRIEAKKARQGR